MGVCAVLSARAASSTSWLAVKDKIGLRANVPLYEISSKNGSAPPRLVSGKTRMIPPRAQARRRLDSEVHNDGQTHVSASVAIVSERDNSDFAVEWADDEIKNSWQTRGVMQIDGVPCPW